MSARSWSRVLALGGAFLALVLAAKYFVADVYLVETPSMRPTLFGGRDRPDGAVVSEHVLVRYHHGFRPERFDLVVAEAPGGGAPLVKRVVALPGEAVAIRGGDLFLGNPGAHLPADAPRPAPIPVFDQRWQDVGEVFAPRGDAVVEREGQEWCLGKEGVGETWFEYHPELRDGYLDRDHRPVDGIREVNDAVLTLEARFDGSAAGTRLRLFLVEEGDRFELEVERTGTGVTVSLLRRWPPATRVPDEPPEVLECEAFALDAADWLRLSLSNLDDHLEVHLDPPGRTLRHDYAGNRPWPRGEATPGHATLGPQAGFGVVGGRARFRAVVLARDLYYTDVGTFALGAPLLLGPDECFLLGDNSAVSTDSRHFGPVPLSDLLGTAEAVVWPTWRWLRPVGPP